MVCPKCKKENVLVHAVTETVSKKVKHGIIWWICIGWWLEPILWICLTLPRLLIALFMPKKQVIVSVTKTMCVCQECGYTWEKK